MGQPAFLSSTPRALLDASASAACAMTYGEARPPPDAAASPRRATQSMRSPIPDMRCMPDYLSMRGDHLYHEIIEY